MRPTTPSAKVRWAAVTAVKKIRTYNFPQDRVTDHRIGLTLRNLQGVLDGDLDRVVEPLILADREEKLKQSSTEEGK